MHQFETTLDKVPQQVHAISNFLSSVTAEGDFILSFYDVPIEFWGKISQCEFPCEIIVDLKDSELDQKLPEALKGHYYRGDKVILSFPYEFEQLLRADIEIEDIALVIDGDITDSKRLRQALSVLDFFGDSLLKLSDYTFTFWVQQFSDEDLMPPHDGTTTIAVDLDGTTPVLIVDLESANSDVVQIVEDHPFKKAFESNTGINLRVYHRAAALIKRLKKEAKN